jgi:NAD(P)-dependent dehydrogenase (short-subunit alcohol dehydrogenase family)
MELAETQNGVEFYFPLVTLDVRNSESIQAALQNHHSSGRLDIVINNAGVGITGPLEEIPSEEIKITLRLTWTY